MDTGPFGSPRPTERRVPTRPTPSPEPSQRPPETPRHEVKEEVKPVYREATHHRSTKEPKSLKRVVLAIVAALVVVALAFAAWLVITSMHGNTNGIDKSKYQAVFFANGQIYFGKLEDLNDNNYKLTSVYYVQNQAATSAETDSETQSNTSNNNYKLVPIVDEIHGPEDEMFIPKSQVLFFENLKQDGKVSQLISQHQEAN